MSDTTGAETRPYHHGDLRRALVAAARQILERDGPAALSLRAVAREAGVSPAAPYHHFKDKNELLDAVAQEGWDELGRCLAQAQSGGAPSGEDAHHLGVAYVRFARANPALYRVMYDCSRNRAALPEDQHGGADSAYARTRATLVEAGADPNDAVGLELATIAAWCAAHGLAEMASFRQFEPLKAALGGEEAFIRGVFEHLSLSAGRDRR